MKKTYAYLFGASLTILLFACNQHTKVADSSTAESEIRNAEKAFEQMAAEKGIAEAFAFFADSNAVIKRGANDSIIQGREGIRNYYSAPYFKTASVKWTPDFVNVSKSGDMGFTYGRFVWTAPDSMGKTKEIRGMFHTVWKKQDDGSWKYVWD